MPKHGCFPDHWHGCVGSLPSVPHIWAQRCPHIWPECGMLFPGSDDGNFTSPLPDVRPELKIAMQTNLFSESTWWAFQSYWDWSTVLFTNLSDHTSFSSECRGRRRETIRAVRQWMEVLISGCGTSRSPWRKVCPVPPAPCPMPVPRPFPCHPGLLTSSLFKVLEDKGFIICNKARFIVLSRSTLQFSLTPWQPHSIP